MVHAEGGGSTCRHHDDGQADAEAQHQGNAQGEFAKLQAEQQDGDRCRTRDQAAGEAEGDDLGCCDVAIGKALADGGGVLALMGILEARRADVEAMSMVLVLVMIVTVVMMVMVLMPGHPLLPLLVLPV